MYLLGDRSQVFELYNFKTHLILRNLRARGTRQRGIPYGAGFDFVSCANYYWETLAWLVFAILVSCFTGMSLFPSHQCLSVQKKEVTPTKKTVKKKNIYRYTFLRKQIRVLHAWTQHGYFS